ncbi:MAG: gamma-glutamyltransferase [Caulobacteraceae bacterium]|nr:gamma-glutamyltransferase [Caulobacteraceae bacterium]
MVVTSQHLASDIGAAVLRRGGNAVDAAVAVGYALAVTHPCCGNLGGGGFMLIHLKDGKNAFINFRERAPLAATADMYLDAKGDPIPEKSLAGWLAVGTPGTVMGLETARAEYGTMPRAALIAPAIDLAENGFILQPSEVKVINDGVTASPPGSTVPAIFSNHGKPFVAGDRLVQKDLAASLRLISNGGAQAFYRGANADAVAAASRANGGLLTRADFETYTVTQDAPVTCSYRGYTVISAPPPSSGGVTLCEMLNILQGYQLGHHGWRSAEEVHLVTEAMRRAYFDRNRSLGDPAFVDNPVGRLTSMAYADGLRGGIDPGHATPSAALGEAAAPAEKATTTHYSVVDKWGNAVSVTYTINDDFGAKVIAGRTGYILNDEMDDFTAKPGSPNAFGLVQGKANAIAAGKRPLSSMDPTIVLKNGKPVLVVGTPGGARIITTVLEILVAVIDHQVPLQEAVDAPRYHHQWLPDTLQAESGALTPETVAALEAMGHKVVPLEVWGAGNSAAVIGIAPHDSAAAHALGFPHTDVLLGANDARTPAGSAVAP